MQKILIIDDHALFIEGLISILQKNKPNIQIYCAITIDAAKNIIKNHNHVTLILLDRTLPGVDSLCYIRYFLSIDPKIRIAIMSAYESAQYISEAIEAGAIGFIPKSLSIDQTIHAIDALLNGNIFLPKHVFDKNLKKTNSPSENLLTQKQLEILSLASLGQSNKKIATNLNLTEGSVKQHFNKILDRLEADNRTHAINIARTHGLIS